MKKHLKISLINLLLPFFFFTALAQAQETRLDSILYDFNNKPEEILVMAHRSAHEKFPENSLAAMEEGIRLKVDILELDLRKTKDGKLIIMHDATVDRTTNGSGKIDSLTFKELRKLRLLYNGKPTDQKVPTFEEVLGLTKGKIMIDIDFKIDDKESILQTFELLKKYHAEKQVLFFLYDYKYTPKVHAINPSVKLMPRAYSTCDVENLLKYDYVPIVHIDHAFYNDYLMKKMAYHGMRILVKTMGDIDAMEEEKVGSGFGKVLKEKYVNVIQTNLPEELLTFLKSKGRHR